MNFTSFSLLMIFLFSTSSSFANEQLSKIQIQIVNSSLHNKHIQVKDEICTDTLATKCELAEYIIDSDECKNDRKAEKCKDAQEVIARESCVEGLVYNGQIARGETITVDICTSYTRNGRVAIRNGTNGAWVHYRWVGAGETIKTH